MDLLSFVVLVGVLVFVHEVGHFAWAKFFGVEVLKFSLGFGPKIAGFVRGRTEYVVGAFPLGGYVRLLGESPADVVRPEDEARSFHGQALWKRAVIVFAGPAMNLAFPVLLFVLVALGESELAPPVIGTVVPGRPADGLLLPGDRILSIDGEPIETFHEQTRIVAESPGEPLEFVVERRGEEVRVTVTPVLTTVLRPLDRVEQLGRIGVGPHHPLSVVGVTSPRSPAGAAGLRTFDRIVSVNGRPIDKFVDLERAFERNSGALVPVTYLRPVRLARTLGGLAEMEVYEARLATITPDSGEGPALGRAGIERTDLYVSDVVAGSREHRMGAQRGDRVVSLDGEPIATWEGMRQALARGAGREHQLLVRRGEAEVSMTYRIAALGDDLLAAGPSLGIEHWVPARVDPLVENPSPILHAIGEALRRTGEMVELTVFSIVRLFEGRVSVDALGGPLMIYEHAGAAAREGPINYLTLMAFVSVNLGVLNLLPVPLLDGGHLAFFLFEAAARRRPSQRVRQVASLVGLLVLVAVMVLAFTNDLGRLWPSIVERFSA